MSDCFAEYAAQVDLDYLSLAVIARADRAARNIAHALACVACLDFAQSVWPGELPLAPMRRAGLWTERGV